MLFVSTTKERTARLQGILADHRRDIALTTLVHSKADAIADIARQHDVLLFDFAIGPEALERTLSALRTSPLGASIAILVPQQTALPPSVSSLANACVIETTSPAAVGGGAARRGLDAVAAASTRRARRVPREDFFWKAFERCRCRCSSSTPAARSSTPTPRAPSSPTASSSTARRWRRSSSPEDAPAIAELIADGFAGGHDDTPVFTAPPPTADGAGRARRRCRSCPGADGQPSSRCAASCAPSDRPAEPPAPPVAGPRGRRRVAHRVSATSLSRSLEAARRETGVVQGELEEVRQQEARPDASVTSCAASSRSRSATSSGHASWSADGASRVGELERVVADHGAGRGRLGTGAGQLAAAPEELKTCAASRDETLKRATAGGDAENAAAVARSVQIEAGARQASRS